MRRRKSKKSSLLTAFLMTIGVVLLSCIGVHAAETTKDGLSVEIISDKESYSLTDEIKLDFKVTNTKEEDVENVTLSAVLPDVLDTKNQKSANTAILKAGEALELHVNATMKPATEDTTSAATPNGAGTGTATTSGTTTAAVQTGQSGLLFVVCLVAMLAALAAVWYFKSHRDVKHQGSIKKMISLVLCLSVLSGTLLSTGLPVLAEETSVSQEAFSASKEIEVGGTKLTVGAKVEYNTESTGIVTKAQWIEMLVEEFSIPESEYANDQLPYNDISEHKAKTAIVTAFMRGILPTETDSFKPDDAATREFAATTLNKCLGFVPNDELSCTDATEITYQDDVEALIERGWFTLINNHFLPKKAITKEEKQNIRAKIPAELAKTTIDTEHENKIVLADEVIPLEKTSFVLVEENTVTLSETTESESIQKGSVCLIASPENANETLAFKVEEIEHTANGIRITYSKPRFVEIYKEMDVQGTACQISDNKSGEPVGTWWDDLGALWDDFKNSVLRIEQTLKKLVDPVKNIHNTATIDTSLLRFENKEFTWKSEHGDSITVTLDGGLENPEIEYLIRYERDDNFFKTNPLKLFKDNYEFMVNLKNEVKFNGSIKVKSSGEAGRMEIADIPVDIVPGVIGATIKISLVVSVEGSVSIEYSLVNEMKAIATKDGLAAPSSYTDRTLSAKADVELKVGISSGIALRLLETDVIGLEGEIGGKGHVHGQKFAHSDNREHTDLSAFMYFDMHIKTYDLVEWLLKDVLHKKSSLTMNLFDEKNSPIKYQTHIETYWDDEKTDLIMESMDKCTYRFVTGTIKNGDRDVPNAEIGIYCDSRLVSGATMENTVLVATNDFGKYQAHILLPQVIPGIKNDYPDKMEIRVKLDGETVYSKEINVKVGEETEVNIDLQPKDDPQPDPEPDTKPTPHDETLEEEMEKYSLETLVGMWDQPNARIKRTHNCIDFYRNSYSNTGTSLLAAPYIGTYNGYQITNSGTHNFFNYFYNSTTGDLTVTDIKIYPYTSTYNFTLKRISVAEMESKTNRDGYYAFNDEKLYFTTYEFNKVPTNTADNYHLPHLINLLSADIFQVKLSGENKLADYNDITYSKMFE